MNMKKLTIPRQLTPDQNLVRSWSVDHPKFYGIKATDEFVEILFETEGRLRSGVTENLDPHICCLVCNIAAFIFTRLPAYIYNQPNSNTHKLRAFLR